MRWLSVSCVLFALACATPTSVARTDLAGWPVLPVRPAEYGGYSTRSVLITMRDGTKLAADVHLPSGLAPGTKLPTILRQTRYWRRIDYRFPFTVFLGDRRYGRTRPFFVTRGYAWVDVDVRGTGASDGVWTAPWSTEEVADGRDVVDWIVKQDWSSGAVGTLGISYDGTAAELALLNRHPAVKAAAPRFAPFDVYADMAFPGGVQLTWMTETWSRLNDALDANELKRFFGAAAVAASGVAQVPGEARPTPEMLAARAKNLDVHEQVSGLTFRDDSPADHPGRGIDDLSPHARADALKATGVPMYVESGWNDGACVRSSVHRFLNAAAEGSRLVIGPWEHGGRQNLSPWARDPDARFDHDAELLRFFDRWLLGRDEGESSRPRVAWFQVGAETWRTADAWPPPAQPRDFFLAAGNALAGAAGATGRDELKVDPAFGTGREARWNSLINLADIPMQPVDQAPLDERRLVYTSPPLDRALDVTGHPQLELYVEADAADAAVFAWLEDVDEQGRAWPVTEGMLRALHRQTHDSGPYRTVAPWRSYLKADAQPLVPGEAARLVVELLPTSWRFRPGHRVRLALSGAEKDHFAPVPGGATRLWIHHGAPASRLTLPAVAAPPPAR